jgi:multisubunit Na+/H+ antiporter MnhG subunit
MSWRAIVALVLLVAGGLLEVLSVLGLCVMRDVYDRLHYVGLASFGALLIAGSIVVRESFSLIGDKSLLVGAILVLTGPVLVQSTARSLLTREHDDWRIKARQIEQSGRAEGGDEGGAGAAGK